MSNLPFVSTEKSRIKKSSTNNLELKISNKKSKMKKLDFLVFILREADAMISSVGLFYLN